MENLNEDIKKQMIAQRLDQYRQQLFSLEMNRVAFKASGESTVETERSIASVTKAFEAIKEMGECLNSDFQKETQQ